MPIYEYQCESCGHQFDTIQKFSDDPLKDCPECDVAALKKMVSAPSFRLKGSGWYETDFKDKKSSNAKSGDSSSSSSSSSTSSDSASSSSDSSSSSGSSSSDSKSAASSSAD